VRIARRIVFYVICISTIQYNTIQYKVSRMSNSQLLAKMAELKTITADYNSIMGTYTPAVDITASGGSGNTPVGTNTRYTFNDAGINAMSSTATPLVVRPGEDYKDYWKYVGKVVPAAGEGSNKYTNSQKCWNMAANDPRLFKAVVYTGVAGTNIGRPEWDNHCYGLMWDAAGTDVSYNTASTGYVTMVGRTSGGGTNGIYTKMNIKNATSSVETDNITKASRLYDLQLRVNSLVEEIALLSSGGINTELNALVGSATDSNTLIEKINQYMNTSVGDITRDYDLTTKRKEMNNVYSEINEQRTLRARKYRFVFYIILAISMIIGYASYTSKMPIIEQIYTLKDYIPFGWWTNWWIITIVVIVFILSSFGWDMKGNILMVIRYISDPEFWTGQLWWVGVTFLLLVVIFFYASFKSFFVEFDAGMKGIQEGLDGDE
jgi:hypothetical protein